MSGSQGHNQVHLLSRVSLFSHVDIAARIFSIATRVYWTRRKSRTRKCASTCTLPVIVMGRQRSYRKVMFSMLSVSLSVHWGEGGAMWPLPMMHWSHHNGSTHVQWLPIAPALAPSPAMNWFHFVQLVHHCPVSPNMFKLVQLGPRCAGATSTSPHMFKVVHHEERTVSKRAVGILLECFLVFESFRTESLTTDTGWLFNLFDLFCFFFI